MPLDTGRITELQEDAVDGAGPDLTDAAAPSLNTGASIGDALRAVREHQGLTVEDVAETTRVRRAYLCAIEDMRLETLPSRPFTIGYVRAYAQALGLDGDAAVARFKADEPVLDEPLREPVGVRDERDPRMVAFVVAAIIIVIAIVVWNVAQRAMTAGAPPASTAPEAAVGKALAEAPDGQVSLGAPLPA
ncbi:helix-turn-helix domain-containing protein, partial [Phenylobacterium sp.]|uniref:helix-turn-helix domain-containing protein n=1 Tax=Phenylobacterium sp. TaxID=1871053 RepID=UPI0039834C3D